MNSLSNMLFGTVRRAAFIIIMMITALSILLFCLIDQLRQRNRGEELVMQVFGLQQKQALMMAGDANYLYTLLQSSGTGERDYAESEVEKKIEDTNETLSVRKQEMTDALEMIQSGHFQAGGFGFRIEEYMKDGAQVRSRLVGLWVEITGDLDILAAAEVKKLSFADQVLRIHENSLLLVEQSRELEDIILGGIGEAGTRKEMGILGACGAVLAALLLALYFLVRRIKNPAPTIEPPGGKLLYSAVSDVNDMFYKINSLISLIENINNNSSFVETLNFINSAFSNFIPYNYIGIALIDEEKKTLRASYGVSDGSIIGLPEGILGSVWDIKETSLGELIRTGEARIINDLEKYTYGKPMKAYNAAILKAGIRASITLPLKVAGEQVGVIFFSSSRKHVYNSGHLSFLNSLVNSIAISFKQNIVINDILYSSVLALAKLAEARDEETGEHLIRMRKYSRLIAELLYEQKIYPEEVNLEFIDGIDRFSPLHDIGKVGVGDKILLKPGKLTEDEFNEMKWHTIYGAEVLRTAEKNMSKTGKSWFGMGIEIAEYHHEKWDGSGYPHGRKGKEIPLSARIVAVADVFDALTSSRPYKEAFSLETSWKLLMEGRGKHFDPNIIDILMQNRNRLETLFCYLWSEKRPA